MSPGLSRATAPLTAWMGPCMVTPGGEEIVNGRVRRAYGLTPPGAEALRAEAARMAEAARLVTDRGTDRRGPARPRLVLGACPALVALPW